MKLHEEFKLYENMWEELTESAAVVYFDQERQDDVDALLNKIKVDNVTVVGSPKDFIQSMEQSEEGKVKFYTDAEGLKEIEADFKNFPQHIKDRLFNNIILVEATASTELTEAVKGPCYVIKAKDNTGKVVFNSVTNGKTYPELEDVIKALQTEKELDMKNHYEIIWVNSGSTLQ